MPKAKSKSARRDDAVRKGIVLALAQRPKTRREKNKSRERDADVRAGIHGALDAFKDKQMWPAQRYKDMIDERGLQRRGPNRGGRGGREQRATR